MAATDTDRPWRPSTAYQAATVSARAFRDLGLPDQALAAVARARAIAGAAGKTGLTETRLDHIESGALVQQLSNVAGQPGVDPNLVRLGIEDVAARVGRQVAADVAAGESTLPAATLLAALARLAQRAGADVGTVRAALGAARGPLEGHAGELVDALVDPPTTPEEIGAFVQGLDATRHAVDASTDIRVVSEFARAALARPDAPPERVAALVEWLADRSVRPLGRADADPDADRRDALQRRLVRAALRGEEDAESLGALQRLQRTSPPPRGGLNPDGPDAIATTMARLADQGVDVIAFALAGPDEGGLVVVSSAAGDLVVHRHGANAFDPTAFARWRRSYPRGYEPGSATAGFDLTDVERSLEGLALPVSAAGGPVVLVPETALQAIPPNLARSDRPAEGVSPLLGLGRPTAVVPSLTWLRSARDADRPVGGERIAWIPTPPEPPPGRLFSILDLLRDATAPALIRHGFTVESDPGPSDRIGQAGLAVVGAHGSVHDAGDRFRAVSDEGHLILSPTRIAGLVGGSDIAILFVCHGGRLDGHPYAVATTGLAHLLLDRGTRAVLASPWPLDVSVPGHWLPAFLDAWGDGLSIAEANFEANRTVARDYSHHPSHCLAMNLLGDPLLRLG